MQGNPIAYLVSAKPLRLVNVAAYDDLIVERRESSFDTLYSLYPHVDANHNAVCLHSPSQKMLSFGQSKDTDRVCHQSQKQGCCQQQLRMN